MLLSPEPASQFFKRLAAPRHIRKRNIIETNTFKRLKTVARGDRLAGSSTATCTAQVPPAACAAFA
jgi:hypothetical protein